jgi:hypothetical protein
MRRALAASSLVLALAVAFTAPASAAQLVLTGGQQPYSFASARCGDAVAATNPATTTTTNVVALSGIDAACPGLPISVQLYDTGTAATVTGTATVPAAGGSVTVAMAASYTPTASAVISVTIASWPIPTTWTYTAPTGNVNTCEVRNADGSVDTTKPCTFTGTPSSSYWGSSGSGQGNSSTRFSAPGIANDQYVAFTVTIVGAPSWWSWSNAGLTTINNSGTVTSSCSALPTFSGQLPPNIGPKPNVYVAFVENRTGSAGIVCNVP